MVYVLTVLFRIHYHRTSEQPDETNLRYFSKKIRWIFATNLSMLLLFLVFLFRLGRDDVCDGWMYCCGLLAAGRLLLGIAQWCKGGSLSYHGAFTTHGRHARVGCVGYTAGDQQLSSKGRFSCHRCLRPSPSVTFRALRERGAVRFHGPDANGFAGDQRTAQIRRSVEKSFRSQFPSFFLKSNICPILFPTFLESVFQ